jgi:hypothetical protein
LHRSEGAAIYIQTQYRGYQDRKIFNEDKGQLLLVVKLQAVFRGNVTRANINKKNALAACIQASQTDAVEKRRIVARNSAAYTIQSVQRGLSERRELNFQTAAALKIQSFVRGYQALDKLQNLVRKKSMLARLQKFAKSVVVIQSLLRAKNARKSVMEKQGTQQNLHLSTLGVDVHAPLQSAVSCNESSLFEKSIHKEQATSAVLEHEQNSTSIIGTISFNQKVQAAAVDLSLETAFQQQLEREIQARLDREVQSRKSAEASAALATKLSTQLCQDMEIEKARFKTAKDEYKTSLETMRQELEEKQREQALFESKWQEERRERALHEQQHATMLEQRALESHQEHEEYIARYPETRK